MGELLVLSLSNPSGPKLLYLHGPKLLYLHGPKLLYLHGPKLLYLHGPKLHNRGTFTEFNTCRLEYFAMLKQAPTCKSTLWVDFILHMDKIFAMPLLCSQISQPGGILVLCVGVRSDGVTQ